MKQFTIAIAMTALSLCGACSADVISVWNVADSPKNAEELFAEQVGGDLIFSSITGHGILVRNGSASEGQFSAKQWTTAAQRDEENYYQFQVAIPDDLSAASMVLDAITLPLAREVSKNDWKVGAESWDLLVSHDGFDTPGTWTDTASLAGTDSEVPTAVRFDMGETQLHAGQTLTVRLYGYGGTFWNNYAGLYGGNTPETSMISVEASYVPVPEPATASLLAVGLAALLMRRPRRT